MKDIVIFAPIDKDQTLIECKKIYLNFIHHLELMSLDAKPLFLLNRKSKIRLLSAKLAKSKFFQVFILASIVFNCIALCIFDYEKRLG